MKIRLLTIIAIFSLSCSNVQTPNPKDTTQFEQELNDLKAYFNIPGLAALVKKGDQTLFESYSGFANVTTQHVVTANTPFPVASLTKIFSGILIMKLVEAGKLSLDESIKKYLPETELSDSILIKHLLSHTSQGEIGKRFYYSYRFGLLTPVVEKASGMSFEAFMQQEIIQPLQLANTFLLKDEAQLTAMPKPIAQPYFFEGETVDGFIDYGFSTSSGIVTTAQDLAIFDNALNQNKLISEASKKKMFTPFKKNLPYGHGIFSQTIQGIQINWGYGQYDCYSSLFLKVPEKDLTLILLANNNLMSDPARLINGDIGYSLFAISFLKNFVFEEPDMPLLETAETLKASETKPSNLHRQKLLAEAIATSFMGRYTESERQKSIALLEKVFRLYPNYLDYAHPTFMHNLNFLKDVAFYKELGKFENYDEELLAIGNHLLKTAPDNPYVNIYLGSFYDRKGQVKQAKPYFETIVNAENFSPFWYTKQAENWLSEVEGRE